MGLEFLAYPELDRLFGGAADKYRRLHLIQALNTFAICAAIDHFPTHGIRASDGNGGRAPCDMA